MISGGKIFWHYGFDYTGKIKEGSTVVSQYGTRLKNSNYFIGDNLELLVGSIQELELEEITLQFGMNGKDMIEHYKKKKFGNNIRIDVLERLVLDQKVNFEIQFIPKWNTGLAILSLSVNQQLTEDEWIILERMFSHRPVTRDGSIFLTKSNSLTEYIVAKLRSLRDSCGIIVDSSPREILNSLYAFAIFETNSSFEKNMLGVLTLAINYETSSESDVIRMRDSSIDLTRGDKLYLSAYSGGVSCLRLMHHDSRYNHFVNLIFLLVLMKCLTYHIFRESIRISSEKPKIADIERVLEENSRLDMLLAPNSLSHAFHFNFKILPEFFQMTHLEKVRNSLEEALKIFQDTSDRQQSRTRNILLVVISVAIAVFTLMQLILYISSH